MRCFSKAFEETSCWLHDFFMNPLSNWVLWKFLISNSRLMRLLRLFRVKEHHKRDDLVPKKFSWQIEDLLIRSRWLKRRIFLPHSMKRKMWRRKVKVDWDTSLLKLLFIIQPSWHAELKYDWTRWDKIFNGVDCLGAEATRKVIKLFLSEFHQFWGGWGRDDALN